MSAVAYIDSSVLLGAVFAEARRPPPEVWATPLVASRLAEYEVIDRLHARRAGVEAHRVARALLERITLIELHAEFLARALEPWPVPVRTLGALHLSTALTLRAKGLPIALLTYDQRMAEAGTALGLPLLDG